MLTKALVHLFPVYRPVHHQHHLLDNYYLLHDFTLVLLLARDSLIFDEAIVEFFLGNCSFPYTNKTRQVIVEDKSSGESVLCLHWGNRPSQQQQCVITTNNLVRAMPWP